MKRDFGALSYSEKERVCESIFISNGPYWHLYTDGTKMQNIFCSEEDFKIGMWSLATSLHLCSSVRALTFELMANHIHFILSGQKVECVKVFELFLSRLKQVFAKSGRAINWSCFKMDILPIVDIKALRNEIIYVNRNAYVASSAYTPDSYLWGGGCAYFNPWLKYLKVSPLGNQKVNIQRSLLHTRDVSPFSNMAEISSIPFIPSFCDIKLGESIFRDARSYFNALTRNAEAFSEIASRLKDTIFLTDEELYSVVRSYIDIEYSVKAVSLLTAKQKIDTARHLHFNYNATKQQLRRILRIDLPVLEELFPEEIRSAKERVCLQK